MTGKSRKVEFLYLNQDEVIQCGALDMTMVMERIEHLFTLHEKGETIVPDKITLRWGDAASEAVTGRINAMPGYVGGDVDTAGIKWIGSKPMNPLNYDLPRASALTILNDPETGFPISVMDGTVISAMRTGAVTGVAAKHLAREDSRRATFIGAGTQNHTQLLAVTTAVPDIEEVCICDISAERVDAFLETETAKHPGRSFKGTTSAEEAVRGADIIVTATTSLKPIVKADWIKAGAFLANVGNYEFEFEAIEAAGKIVVDNWEAVIHRGIQTVAIIVNEGRMNRDRLHAELGEITSGKRPGRENNLETIYFCAVGMGAEDIIVGRRIYEEARIRGIGTWLTLWNNPVWI